MSYCATAGCLSTGGRWFAQALRQNELSQFDIADPERLRGLIRPLNFSSREVAIDRRPREPCFGRGWR
ncbi:hypothetical protein KMZ29_14150 [Bradyrhizobium sediminis]|uniref:Uncharacterized protein n=1 Tax=Bradyrhizobium sediminis TaxID=2840469 RepID=A0A975N9E3_9BRAD|nr:hypothetical protein [Bradyrhizobium sediminis]QWG10927.1 hypothetical protein KMZ29_14150 [Bradyrhizobium sediminis]